MTDTGVKTRNPYLDEYHALWEHQKEHIPVVTNVLCAPEEYCYECLRSDTRDFEHSSMRRKWSWAIPNDDALDAIVKYSPHGLIEIGAGAGYWCSLLRDRGLDVLAYDINPPPKSSWTNRQTSFTEVIEGDHTNVVGKGKRTLLTCWPERYGDWMREMVEKFEGDTIVYVGEKPPNTCTGDPQMHMRLGMLECCHEVGCEVCLSPLFRLTEQVEIPVWSGMWDRLYVCSRI